MLLVIPKLLPASYAFMRVILTLYVIAGQYNGLVFVD